MTRYDLVAMLHGFGVIAWVGGGVALLVLHALAACTADDGGCRRSPESLLVTPLPA